ncbi:MAG: LamG domain-containing protein, partial [Silvibacterium sp.]
MRKSIVLSAVVAACLFLGLNAKAQLEVPFTTPTNNPPVYGPYNGTFLTGGDGLEKKITENDTVLEADAPWTFFAWVNPSEVPTAPELVAGFGSPEDEYSRYLALAPGKLILWGGKNNSLEASVTLAPGQWHFIAASFDGQQFHLYSDGAQVATGSLILGSVANTLDLAPGTREPGWSHFGGKIAGLTLAREALTADAIAQISKKGDDFAMAVFEEGSKPWPVQTRGQAGYRAPQDASQMPRSKAPFTAPVA